jgi:hypothetical protein
MFSIISIVSIFIPFLVIGSIVGIIMLMVKAKQNKVKFKLSTKTLLHIYLYAISFLTLGIAVIGATIALNAAISYKVEIPFSYTLQRINTQIENIPEGEKSMPECYNGKPITFYEKEFCFDSAQRKTDLINGMTIFISMVILFAIHQYAIYKIPKKDIIHWLKKIYTFFSLILYSIIGIIAIPTAIYQLTNYLLFEPSDTMYSTPYAPAASIIVVLISVPLWIFFLKKTSSLKEGR